MYADTFWLVGAGLAFVLPCLVFLLVFLSSEAGVGGLGLGLSLFALIFCLGGGAMHFSNTRRFGHLAGAGREQADAIARRYPKGAQVKVAYCPSDPDLARLEPGITPEAHWLPGAGLAVQTGDSTLIPLFPPGARRRSGGRKW